MLHQCVYGLFGTTNNKNILATLQPMKLRQTFLQFLSIFKASIYKEKLFVLLGS